jgi:hypothetical protein
VTSLYWIRNSTCEKVEEHGYVGVSEDPEHRFKQHRKRNSRIPADAWIEIIFEGTREECFIKEHALRPFKKIGWNNAVGGEQGFKIGFKHSDETKIKLKSAWTDDRRAVASKFRSEFNKSLVGQKRTAQSEAMLGDKNPMYGKTHDLETRLKISKSNIGKIPPNKQELYCIGCRQRTSLHVLSRHKKCWIKYINGKYNAKDIETTSN